MQNDIDPREMAGAPRSSRKDASKNGTTTTTAVAAASTTETPKPNRFAAVFGVIPPSFAPVTGENKPLPLRGGGEQKRRAQAVIHIGDTGAFIPGAYVVERTSADGTRRFRLQWPSTGTSFKRVMIDTEDEHAARDLELFGSSVIEAWKKWQRNRKANNEIAASVIPGVGVTDAELAELGLD